MYMGGVLEVHDNVVFEANTAGSYGGAVSLQLDTLHFFLLWCFATGFARVLGFCEVFAQAHSVFAQARSQRFVVELQSRKGHTFSIHSPSQEGLCLVERSAGGAQLCGV